MAVRLTVYCKSLLIRGDFMLKKERQEKILDLLQMNDYLSIPEISSNLNVSDMTIRRDINELAEQSLLVKIYGAAQKLTPMYQRKNLLERS